MYFKLHVVNVVNSLSALSTANNLLFVPSLHSVMSFKCSAKQGCLLITIYFFVYFELILVRLCIVYFCKYFSNNFVIKGPQVGFCNEAIFWLCGMFK